MRSGRRVTVMGLALAMALTGCTSSSPRATSTSSVARASPASRASPTSSPAASPRVGPPTIRAKAKTRCPKQVLSPGPPGTPLPARAIGPQAAATGDVIFALADKRPLFGVVYPAISIDGGQTWHVDGPCFYYAAAQGPNVTSRIAAVAPDWAYAWGPGGQVVKVTHDGGAQWFAAVLPPIRRIVSSGNTLHALLFESSSKYVSRDYGLTWHVVEPKP